jgi:hypothetical protein
MRIAGRGFVRAGLIAPLVVVAGLTATGWAVAAPAPSDVAAPYEHGAAADSRYVGTYLLYSWCQQAGRDGVASGEWQTFTCAPERAGLDTWWALWVSP